MDASAQPDGSASGDVLGKVDDAHAAATEQPFDPVVPDLGADPRVRAHERSFVPQFVQNRLSAEFAVPQFEHVSSSSAFGGGTGGTIEAVHGPVTVARACEGSIEIHATAKVADRPKSANARLMTGPR
jgi:hypothetical protein